MKKLLYAFILISSYTRVYADSKVQNLTQDTTAQYSDIFYKANVDGGAYDSRGINLANILTAGATQFLGSTGQYVSSVTANPPLVVITVGTNGSTVTISMGNNLPGGSTSYIGSTALYVASVTTNASLNETFTGTSGATVTLSVNVSSISLPSSSVGGAGSCTGCNLSYDTHGLITAAANGSGGSGSGIVSPGTFTWVNNFGINVSTVVIDSGTALGINSGVARARFRMGGIISLQNVNADGADSTGVFLAAASTSTGSPAFFTARRSSGTTASPLATQAGQNILQVSGGGYGTTGWSNSSTGRMDFLAEENFTDSSMATGWQLQTTPSGSLTTVPRIYVGGNGAVTVQSSATFISPVLFSSNTFGTFYQGLFAAQAKLSVFGETSPFISNSTGELTPGAYFDDTSTQAVSWTFRVHNYDGRQLTADIVSHSSGTANFTCWEVYTSTNFVSSALATQSQDLATQFNVGVTTAVRVNSTQLAPTLASVALSNTTVANGDMLTIKLERQTGGCGNTESAGQARMTEVDIRE